MKHYKKGEDGEFGEEVFSPKEQEEKPRECYACGAPVYAGQENKTPVCLECWGMMDLIG